MTVQDENRTEPCAADLCGNDAKHHWRFEFPSGDTEDVYWCDEHTSRGESIGVCNYIGEIDNE